MSDGDESANDAEDETADADETEPAEESDDQPEVTDPSTFENRLDEAETVVEDAETEDDLDDADELLEEIEADLEAAVLPEPEPPEDEDEEPEDPKAEFEDRISDLRSQVEDQRGPYLEDVTDEIESAESTITTSEWAEEGEPEVAEAVSTFFSTANETLGESFERTATAPDAVAEELAAARETIAETGLDPDDDAETIATLLEAAGTLESDLEDATLWTDLEIREQLRREGFYDVLEPEVTKDFPPEMSAIKVYETQGEVEPLLSALDKFDSDFMEENLLSALEHFAPVEAYEPVHALAKRRNKQPIRILGRIGDERARDTIEDFLGGGDVELEKISLRALGMIGSEESTDTVAQRLLADNEEIRSSAARALGMIGDTRAIEPLGDVLDEEDDDAVRASAAWALTQIGTEDALETAAAYADDRSYLVQKEAEKATGV